MAETIATPRRVRPKPKPAPLSLADALRAAIERTNDERLRDWLAALLRGDRADAKK